MLDLVETSSGGPPFEVHAEWTTYSPPQPVGSLEFWVSIEGDSYTLEYTGSSGVDATEFLTRGNEGEILSLKIRYLYGGVYSDFSNVQGCSLESV